MQQADILDLQEFVDDHVEEIAPCLESILYGCFSDRKGIESITKDFSPELRRAAFEDWNDAKRSSPNDYSSYCLKLADALREKVKSE